MVVFQTAKLRRGVPDVPRMLTIVRLTLLLMLQVITTPQLTAAPYTTLEEHPS